MAIATAVGKGGGSKSEWCVWNVWYESVGY
jgi:hypothetical protein